MKTAYGKFVNPLKVETMLRDLPGMVEAMVVGEGRPYCTALIWSDREILNVDESIERMNEQLSHPEQVRAWAVLPNTLSVDGGELTANMKLRRMNVLERHAALIESLYSGAEPPAGVLHVGRARRS